LNILLASSTLRTVAWAQEDFRSNKRMGDEGGYWRKDIAGLYVSLKEPGGTYDPIVLADDRPLTELPRGQDGARKPVQGRFWVRTLRLPDEHHPDRNRFAACCFPAAYAPGIRSHYVINQEGVVYRKDLGHGKGIEIFPTDPVKEGWEAVDVSRLGR
jgi:hypothetical protein